jgi:hypothetical protein
MEESAADRAMVDKELKKRRVALEAAFKNWQRCGVMCVCVCVCVCVVSV